MSGSATDVIPTLRAKYGIGTHTTFVTSICVFNFFLPDKIDFLFIDHVAPLFLSDLKVIEAHNLLKKGSVVVADNVLIPGKYQI